MNNSDTHSNSDTDLNVSNHSNFNNPVSNEKNIEVEQDQLSATPKDIQVDVFEFEPTGFMSDARW